jgi:2-oxoglutarate dehydrogenase E2 component (dihydrolipoamide succinyltransferase)
MSERVTMPALGESVTEGTVTRWLKSVGDTIEVDEPLLEVSTDKVDTEIPSPVAGTLQEILVGEDDTVPVGADLAVIGDGAVGGSEQPSASDTSTQQEPEPEPSAAQDQQPEPEATSSAQAVEEQPPAAGTSDSPSGGTTVTMPALGESVTEGTVTRWLKAEGDQVEVDEPLLEVSTDKVDTEIPSPVAGTVSKILVGEDETVPVGAELAVVGGSGGGSAPAPQQEQQEQQEQAPQQAADTQASDGAPAGTSLQDEAAVHEQAAEQSLQEEKPRGQAPATEDTSAQQDTAPAQQSAPAPQSAPSSAGAAASGSDGGNAGDAAAYVTPLVRKLAAEHSVDLGSLKGTGVGGRIRKQDVLDAAEAARKAQSAPASAPSPASTQAPAAGGAASTPALSPKRGTTEKMSRLRKVIAARMVESLQVSAQLTTVVEVDVTKVSRLRDRAKRDFEAREGVKLSFLPFFALAAVEALKAHPSVNSSVTGDEVTYHGSENLGVAVDTERGLLVPVIQDAGDLNIAGLARKIADLAERTRTNKVSPDELGGGTFTLTNTGSRGALFDTPIINQPNVAILGTGAVVKRPVVVKDADGGESIAIRSMVYLALSYDHRVVDGADAARFLVTMKTRLEEGAFEASLGL